MIGSDKEGGEGRGRGGRGKRKLTRFPYLDIQFCDATFEVKDAF